jgi:hypothetical protein
VLGLEKRRDVIRRRSDLAIWHNIHKTLPQTAVTMSRRIMALLLLVLAVSPSAVVATSKSTKPPLGWSSWYAMGSRVNQTAMEEVSVNA